MKALTKRTCSRRLNKRCCNASLSIIDIGKRLATRGNARHRYRLSGDRWTDSIRYIRATQSNALRRNISTTLKHKTKGELLFFSIQLNIYIRPPSPPLFPLLTLPPHLTNSFPIPLPLNPRMSNMSTLLKPLHPHLDPPLPRFSTMCFDILVRDQFVDFRVEIEARNGREGRGEVEVGVESV